MASAAVADTDANLFAADELEQSYELVLRDAHGADEEGSCGEGSCGEGDDAKDKGKEEGEGSCGEGSCGEKGDDDA